MKFLRSLMEEAKPEAEKSPISKADQRTYTSQVKKSFAGDEKFKTGKVSRAKFANAAIDCVDNCPKNGNCDEKFKTACVKAMWNSYRAKHDGVTEGVIVEAWDDSTEDADVKAADDEAKKHKIKGLSKSKEEDVSKTLAKADKKAEDKGAKKAKALKETTDPKNMCCYKVTLEAGSEKVTYKVTDTDEKAAGKQALAKLAISTHKEKKGKVVSVVKEGFEGSDEDPDVKAAEDEVKRRGIKAMSPRAEKALHKRLEKGDKRDEHRGVVKVKGKAKSKESVEESVQSMEVVKGGFAEFLKQR